MNTCHNSMIRKIFPIVFLSFAGLIPASSLFAQVECRGMLVRSFRGMFLPSSMDWKMKFELNI